MKHLFLLTLAAISLGGPAAASAQDLTEAQARAVIAPWYGLFNVASRGDVKTVQEQVLTSDYESCAGYLPSECWGRDTSIKVVGSFSTSIPDMKFDIKEVLVAGDRVVVRGEVTGTPAGAFWRAPYRQEFQNDDDRHSDHQGRQDRQDVPPRELAQRARATPRPIKSGGAFIGRCRRRMTISRGRHAWLRPRLRLQSSAVRQFGRGRGATLVAAALRAGAALGHRRLAGALRPLSASRAWRSARWPRRQGREYREIRAVDGDEDAHVATRREGDVAHEADAAAALRHQRRLDAVGRRRSPSRDRGRPSARPRRSRSRPPDSAAAVDRVAQRQRLGRPRGCGAARCAMSSPVL